MKAGECCAGDTACRDSWQWNVSTTQISFQVDSFQVAIALPQAIRPLMETKPVATDLIRQVQQYAESVLDQLPSAYTYHSTHHTRQVAQYAEEIGIATGLTDHALENVIVAAWLHDVGYVNGRSNHEERSQEMARTLLDRSGLSEKRIEKVLACIGATKMPQRPQTDAEMVLCDADLSHLATDDFTNSSEQLRMECNALLDNLGRKKWLKETVKFMESHQYFTDYARQKLGPLKQANLDKVRQKLAELKAMGKPEKADPVTSESPDEADGVAKTKRSDRGIETMFRTTSTNHLQLSAMADSKANIMISTNSIIISLVLSVLVRKLEEWPMLILPTILLTGVCLTATVFAILAVRPHITSGRSSREDIHQKTTNLLFFGNFYQMDLADYEWGVRQMMNDADFLYSSMTRDIYYLGRVLGQKYKFLRLSYNVFMFGLVTSVLAFGVAVALSR